MNSPASIHACAALIGEYGVLIRGRSGSGKSNLLLDLLAADPGSAHLVADDRVIVSAVNGRLLADVPAQLAGLVEMRGVGVLKRSYVAPVVIRLVVDLLPREECERLPLADETQVELEGITLPNLRLPIGDQNGARKVQTALSYFINPQG